MPQSIEPTVGICRRVASDTWAAESNVIGIGCDADEDVGVTNVAFWAGVAASDPS